MASMTSQANALMKKYRIDKKQAVKIAFAAKHNNRMGLSAKKRKIFDRLSSNDKDFLVKLYDDMQGDQTSAEKENVFIGGKPLKSEQKILDDPNVSEEEKDKLRLDMDMRNKEKGAHTAQQVEDSEAIQEAIKENPSYVEKKLKTEETPGIKELRTKLTEKLGDKYGGYGTEAAKAGVDAFSRYQAGEFDQKEEKPFGKKSNSDLLRNYDAFVNAVRPGRTGAQKKLAGFAPFLKGGASIGGEFLGSILGAKGGMPVAGATAGSALGSGIAEKGLDYLLKPKGEFSSLGDFISGKRPSIRERLGFGEKPGLITKARRGLGGMISSPDAAQNIRAGLEGAIALYGIGKDLGLNKYVKNAAVSLGQKLGILSPNRVEASGDESGRELVDQVISGVTNRNMPAFRQRASNFLGYDVKPGGFGEERFDAQLRGSMAPIAAKYDIGRARLGRQAQEMKLRQQGQAGERAISGAEQQFASESEKRKFEEGVRNSQLRGKQDLLQAQINAEEQALNTQGVGLGQKLVTNPPVYRQGRVDSPVANALSDTGTNVMRGAARRYFS